MSSREAAADLVLFFLEEDLASLLLGCLLGLRGRWRWRASIGLLLLSVAALLVPFEAGFLGARLLLQLAPFMALAVGLVVAVCV